ncbi:uncharacterized protein [Atheta coriaria]|uniref:uncharacterized protein n=1 Tax=Dalotia coriaria TaxID=877792 RepID=UPI0031F431AF
MVLGLDAIWSKSRKMLVNRSMRRKAHIANENNKNQLKTPQSPQKHQQIESPAKYKSKIPVAIRRYSSTSTSINSERKILQITDLDDSYPKLPETEPEPEPEYSEINTSKYKKNERKKCEVPEYIRKSYAKHNRSYDKHRKSNQSVNINNKQSEGDNTYCNVDSSTVSYRDYQPNKNKCENENKNEILPQLVKCHIYETLTPLKSKYLPSHADCFRDSSDLSDSSDDEPLIIKACATVHPSPVLSKPQNDNQNFNGQQQQSQNSRGSSTPPKFSSNTSRLIKDEHGLYLSPIIPNVTTVDRKSYKMAEQFDISPPHPVDKPCRKNLHDRFVVNTYKASYWQRLSGRVKPRIDATHKIKVSERPDSGWYSHSDSNSDSELKSTNNAIMVTNTAGSQISTSTSTSNSNSASASQSSSAASLLSDVGFVGELYRARITPDKILAKKLRQRQRRVVPTSLLTMFDSMMADSDVPSSPDDEFVQFLDKEASKIEMATNSTKINSLEEIYATPMKTPKDIKETERKKADLSLDTKTFIKLKEEADLQCKIMRQASKALEVSRRSETNCVSVRPQVEAEKILLTANCKYEKVLKEIRQTHYEKPIEAKQTGSIKISDISIKLPELSEDKTGWFVLVLMDDKRIFSTDAVEIHLENHKLDFHRTFLFDNLDGNFELTGKVYCLLHKQCEKNHKKSDGRLSNKLRLSGRKLRYMDLYTKDPVETNIKTSSFVPLGYFKITVNDLHTKVLSKDNKESIKITLYENSPLAHEVQMNIQLAQMNIAVEKMGMLNVRSRINPVVWKRMLCTLSGTVLKLWDNEIDQDPLMLIDLIYCKQEIDNAKREECPRAKTLAIVLRHETLYLNIDTIAELREWKKVLNEVYKGLKDWKLLKE